MKIIMQVKHLGQFINPQEKPKNAFDLSNKIGVNQGLVAYYRGNNALIYKLIINHAMKFLLYETAFQSLNERNNNGEYLTINSVLASSFTALLTTFFTYPLDLAHGRMAADLSKKPSIIMDKNQKTQKTRLYSSVRECLTKTQEDQLTKKKAGNMYKGISSALLAQVPYTVILMGSFEAFYRLVDSQSRTYNSKTDEISFFTKFLTRFGPSTLSLIIAQTICYPLDTVKRRMQLNGSIGHKNLYKSDIDCFKKILKEEGIYKGFYSGFAINLVRCAPLVLIQYIMFQNMRFVTESKNIPKKKQKE